MLIISEPPLGEIFFMVKESWRSCNTASQPYLSVLFGPVWVSSSTLLTDTTGRGKASLCWRVLQSSSLMVRTFSLPTSSTLCPPTFSPGPSSLHRALVITVLSLVESFIVRKYFHSVAMPALLCHKEPAQGTQSWFFMAYG